MMAANAALAPPDAVRELDDHAALLRDFSRPEAADAMRQLRDELARDPWADHPVMVAALIGSGTER